MCSVVPMKPTVVFDVNETLLDLAPIGLWFHRRYGEQLSASQWFAELLRLSFVSSATNRYVPFPTLARSAMVTVTANTGMASPSKDDVAEIGELLERLPPHSDVADGLARLTERGFRITALTNSPQDTAVRQLTNAGIAGSFDAILSVEMVPRFKPHRSVYLAASEQLGSPPSDLIMVAAHDWDIAGALAAGLSGVFVNRAGQHYSDAFPAPTAIVDDVEGAAVWIAGRFTGQDQ